MIRHRISAMFAVVVSLAFILAGGLADQADSQFTGDIKPVIYVSDVEQSVPFYRDVLGFELDGYSGDEANPYYAEMLAGPRKFGLHEPTMPGDESRVGQQRLYFRVRDLLVQRRFIESKGVEVKEVYYRDWMDFFSIEDSDGNIIVFAVTDSERHSTEPWLNESL